MMKAPRARRTMPISERGRMVRSKQEGSFPMLPDREQIEAGRQHDQPGNDGTGAAIVLEVEWCRSGSTGAPNDGEYAERYAGYTQQRENGKERSHVCLGGEREWSQQSLA